MDTLHKGASHLKLQICDQGQQTDRLEKKVGSAK